MFLRYQTGLGRREEEEEGDIQQGQHHHEVIKRTASSPSGSQINSQQKTTSTSSSLRSGATSLMVPGSIVMDSTTTYTNPGFVIVPQLTTVTESGSVIVKTQITVANIPASETVRPSGSNGSSLTALLTDSGRTISQPTMSSMTTIRRTTTSSASRSSTNASNSQTSEPDQGVSPILIFVVVLVIALGVLLSAVSIILYRRSKKRHQRTVEERKVEKAATTLRPFIIAPAGRRNDSLPPPPPPPPPPSPPRSERRVSGAMRKPSSLLPSPLHEFPNADFPVPPMIPRKNPHRPRIPIVPMTPSNFKPRDDPGAPTILSREGPHLRIGMALGPPKLSLETSRTRLPSSSSLSIPSPGSRNKSLTSLESAIDPDLSFTVNGTSRLSTQVGDGMPENRYNSFTYWGDYDFSRRPFSRRRSTHGSPTVTSPRLSPLGENSVWEDALMDVEFDSRTPTDVGGSIKS
ncbi:hypothetical protein TWF730_003905 [Orbilia blumenaviensis]|uniref:Uncharacterized protein n=1 Tax=Orbilia blumenaviensis TaxID=1796055 RepID=A0AAV9U544_9PEZI